MTIDNKATVEICLEPSTKVKIGSTTDGVTGIGDDEPADFEKAITAAQWGKFNLIVYLLSITSGWTSVFETTTMSYVFPAAECDLNLNLQHKGLLNAITYTGMISTGFVWGYLCDTLGRKKLLVIGYLLDGMFVLLSAMSQNFTMLMIAKFFGGAIINGPFSAITTYLSELHCAKHRSKVQMILGTIFSAATLVLPVLAIQVLPLDFQAVLGQNFVIHPWNLYLFICATIPLISGIAFLFLPESPKFLMTMGQNEKALQVFKKIYRMNTGKPEETYPIKVLINEIELNQNKIDGKVRANRTKSEALVEGWSQMKPLFRPPYLSKILFVCLIQIFSMNSLNTLRLWLPQLFQAINDYQYTNNETASLCEMIAVFRPKKKAVNITIENCVMNTNNYSVYTNSMIIAAVSIFGYIFAGGLINKMGKKRLYVCLGIICGVTGMSLLFSRSMIATLTLASLFVMSGSVMINTMLAIIVDLFPTTLRTMTVSVAMMCGRSGAVLGNIIYPYLLASGCAPPFIYVALSSLIPADFETSIASTGFGRYNVLLILICIPAAWTTQFESSLASFIIPAAACDLNLTTSQKGLLNSMAVIGMITSGFIWGVLLDTLGRRKLLLIAFVIDSLLVVGRSLSQEFYVLCAFKFFGGSITGGIYVAINTYLLEFHSTEYRGKIQMIFGMIFCGANIVIPLISSAILPLKFHMQIFVIDFSAWNLLILVTSTTSFISCVGFYFLPESPKFLMSIGDNVGAMEVFKKIYTHNSGKPAESYPISCLLKEIEDKNESPANKKSLIEYFKAGKQQVLPLFGKQYGPKLLLVSVVQSTFQMAINAVRFYMPQIFQGIHEYQVANNETFSDICDVLDILRSPKPDEEYTCLVNLENSFTVYLNSVIIATVALISYGMVGTLINLFGKKRLLITLGITSSVTVSSMYLSKNPASIITLSSLYLATSGICFDLFITVVVVVFPTTLRAMAFSLCLLLGRILTVVGNMGFPMLVEIGCAPPFLAIGGLILVAVALVCIMPNTDKVNMK